MVKHCISALYCIVTVCYSYWKSPYQRSLNEEEDELARITPSVTRALRILELFLNDQYPLSVPEIVSRLGLPRTTTHELVNTLIHSAYLRRDAKHPNKVFLGPKVFELGNVYASKLELISEGRKVAEEIVAKCDETVQMAILDGIEAVFVAKVECSKMVRLVSGVGSRLPAHCTAVGKMPALRPIGKRYRRFI